MTSLNANGWRMKLTLLSAEVYNSDCQDMKIYCCFFFCYVCDDFLIYPWNLCHAHGENNMRSTGCGQDKSNASSLLDKSGMNSLALHCHWTLTENEMHQVIEKKLGVTTIFSYHEIKVGGSQN